MPNGRYGIAEPREDSPSSPTLLPKEKGARIQVPSPFGRARVRANFAIHPAI
jgi:hypothetical protein